MAPPSPEDLGWLKVGAAKRQLSQLTTPMGQDPLFTVLSSSVSLEMNARNSTIPSVALPLGFSSVFELDSKSNQMNNPYFIPATKLSRVFESEDIIFVTLGFVWLVAETTDEFKELLIQKDPKALTLLACWFAKLSTLSVWWYRQRAIIEGQAICLYLEKYHGDDMNIQVLLRYPRSTFQQLPEWDIYPLCFEEYATSPRYSQFTTVAPTPAYTVPNSYASVS